jgi:heme/copper-type cytochrome/quinol oxidase subunit 2
METIYSANSAEQTQHSSQNLPQLPPDNNLVWAILATIFCFMPFGIVSIVYAAKVNNLWLRGYQNEARDAARKAKKWALASLITSVVLWVLYVLLVVSLGVASYMITEQSVVM